MSREQEVYKEIRQKVPRMKYPYHPNIDRDKKSNKFVETSMSFLFLFAKRFIAGETLEEALPVIRQVKERGFLTTVDILGESVTGIHQAKDAADEYCDLLTNLHTNQLEMNISMKLTQLGLDISDQLCFENVCKVLDKAENFNAFVRIDMEGSDYTDRTLNLVERWFEGFGRVGTVIQAMLKRSPADVEKLLAKGITIRLCKGAYKEPKEIAFADKRDVDAQYVKLAERLLSSGSYHGIATHDEKIIEHLKNYVSVHGISKDSFEFQMLYGIRSKLQAELIRDGWRLRTYMPFGNHWLKYTLRRLRERKENIWFVAKNLLRR